jgi:hypothetical protein
MPLPERLVRPADLPDTLYQPSTTLLYFAPILAESYVHVLTERGQLEEARAFLPQGAIGGAAPREASEHFLSAFSGSCARTKLAMLDPKGDLQDASNLFLQSFSGGSVSLFDLPCGAGAATAALLGSIAELRRREVLPAVPLDVYIVGGDISSEALSYAG